MNPPVNALRLGTLYCVFSATAYTVYNLCLRDVSEGYDPAWINCVQASVSVAVFGVYLLWRAIQRRPALPRGRELLALLGISLVTQLGGVLLVWAMSIVGVAVAATLQTGMMLAWSAILGLIVLGERVSWQQIVAILLITVSIVFFTMGAEAGDPAANDHSPHPGVLLGVAAAGLAGLAFAVLTVGVRKAVTGDTLPGAVVFLMNLMGVVALGPWSVYRLGVGSLLATTPRDLGVMLSAGVMNLIAFFLVTKSLQLIPVVRFNVLNNGLTTSLTAAAGIVLLSEPWNATLLTGILLSLAGILTISVTQPSG